MYTLRGRSGVKQGGTAGYYPVPAFIICPGQVFLFFPDNSRHIYKACFSDIRVECMDRF